MCILCGQNLFNRERERGKLRKNDNGGGRTYKMLVATLVCYIEKLLCRRPYEEPATKEEGEKDERGKGLETGKKYLIRTRQ